MELVAANLGNVDLNWGVVFGWNDAITRRTENTQKSA